MQNTAKLSQELTEGSLAVFTAYAEDAGNWGGTPMVDGNVRGSKEQNGHLTDLKKKDFITTWEDDPMDIPLGGESCTWINFTDKGRALAEELDISID